MQRIVPWVALTLVALGCSAESTSTTDSDVVGGRRETGHPSVGYLVKGEDDAPFCVATLVAPDRAVTAAHCLDQMAGDRAWLGFGAFGGDRVEVVERIVHPSWVSERARTSRHWLHDVAVVRIATPSSVTPAARGIAWPGCTNTYVGYGRVTAGGREVVDGYTGERKSASMCLDGVANGMLEAHGEDGGLCWGDSGGPLWVFGRIAGVLHGHADASAPKCEVGNRVVFTSLDAEKRFLSCALSDAAAPSSDTRCHWALGPIQRAIALEGMAIRSDGTLRPESPMTRGEWATLIARVVAPPSRHTAAPIVDLPAGATGDDVLLALRGGYLDGIEDIEGAQRLRVGSRMTRRQAIVGVARGKGLPGDAVTALRTHALLPQFEGSDDLELDDPLTRGEAAALADLARGEEP